MSATARRASSRRPSSATRAAQGPYGTGGVDLEEAAGATPIHNSIIAGNTGTVADVRGYIASDGHNLFSQLGVNGQQPGDIVTEAGSARSPTMAARP